MNDPLEELQKIQAEIASRDFASLFPNSVDNASRAELLELIARLTTFNTETCQLIGRIMEAVGSLMTTNKEKVQESLETIKELKRRLNERN